MTGPDNLTHRRGPFRGTARIVQYISPSYVIVGLACLLAPGPVLALSARLTALPFAGGTLDALFLVFAAHEIRRPELRLRFFQELRRTLAPRGRLLIVEHLRDPANFAAFGPGFFHFLP